MRKIFAQLALSFLSITSLGQIIHSPIQAHYIHAATYSKEFADVFSFTNNQAALCALKKASVGVYSEEKFLLKETSLYSLAFALPTNTGCFGFQANYFGYSAYNESQLGIAYGKHLGKMVDIGVQFNYYNIRIAEYGSAGTMNFEIGAMFHLTENLHIGLHVYNPAGGKFGKNTDEKLASIFNVGAGYEASKQVLISAEIVKEENKPVNVNAGLQYVFAKQFFAKAGVETSSTLLYGAVGFLLNVFRIDIAVNYNPQLGLTPGLLLVYQFNKKE